MELRRPPLPEFIIEMRTSQHPSSANRQKYQRAAAKHIHVPESAYSFAATLELRTHMPLILCLLQPLLLLLALLVTLALRVGQVLAEAAIASSPGQVRMRRSQHDRASAKVGTRGPAPTSAMHYPGSPSPQM